MKKLIFLLTLLIGFSSCSDDDNSESNNPLIGEWKIKSYPFNDIEESIGDCDINHSLSITEDNITNKVFGDCESITNSDCSLSDLSNWSYSKNNNVLTLQLLESIDYCDDPNGVDNTSQSTQNIEFEFSITNGELRLIENMDEVYIYERI